MKVNENTTFNGAYIGTNTTQIINDPIEYCPFCGKKLPEETDIKYCPFCGKAIPRTYTSDSYIIHWNLPNGTVTYPQGY